VPTPPRPASPCCGTRTVRFDAVSLNAFGEVVVDRSRAADGVLSILYQRRSSGTTPSPIRVLDLQLG